VYFFDEDSDYVYLMSDSLSSLNKGKSSPSRKALHKISKKGNAIYTANGFGKSNGVSEMVVEFD